MLGALTITGMMIPSQKVAAAHDVGKTMAVYSLDSNDPYASDTLKTKVILQLAKTNDKIDLDKVDMDNSQVSVSGLNMNQPGIQAVTIKAGLVYTGEDTKAFGYSVTQTAAINVVKTYNPILKLKKSSVIVNNGDAWNPSSYISTISDNSNSLPVLKEVDNVDMTTDGNYYASYTAINAEGYSTSAVLNVIVKTPQEVLDARAQADAAAAEAAAKAEAEAKAKAEAAAQQTTSATFSTGNGAKIFGSGANPYSGGVTNCTATAWALVYSELGVALPNFGNAWNWISSANADGYATGAAPKAGAVAVYTHHVAYVASVSADGSSVYIKEGNYNGGYNERWTAATNEGEQTLIGYIYVQ